MVPRFPRLRQFYRSYRGEIIITAISFVASSVLAVLIAVAFDYRDPYLVGFYFAVCSIILLLFALLFNQRRLIDSRFSKVNRAILDLYGPVSRDNQFFQRRAQYAPEKELLAKVLVSCTLPRVIKKNL